MAAYVPKARIDSQHVAKEAKRLAAYVNSHVAPFANIAVIATADGSDPATTQTLTNATKAKINAMITALKGVGVATNVSLITTPDGSSAGTTQTLANANKAKINALLAALQSAGIMT